MPRQRYRLPAASPPPIKPEAFMIFPVAILPPHTPEQELVQQVLYEWAFAQAQAVVTPSLPERDLAGVWN